jgi:hypothetical protein
MEPDGKKQEDINQPLVIAGKEFKSRLFLGTGKYRNSQEMNASFEASEDRPEWAGEATVYVYDLEGSWALGEYTPAGGTFETRRYGPRAACR